MHFLFFLLAISIVVIDAACPEQNLLPNPPDPGEFGPWPVSARYIGMMTKRNLTTEVWYPGVPGSEKNSSLYTYSPTEHMPDDQKSKVPKCVPPTPPDHHTCCEPTQYADHIWFDLPLDVDHGPYPVILFIHGFCAFREYFLHLVEHWASRGFVVIAADYPGVNMKAILLNLEGHIQPIGDEPGDSKLLLEEFTTLADDRLSFLRGRINITNLGITGHSLGGSATGTLSKTIGLVTIPMAGGGTHRRELGVYSTLVIGGQNDTGGDHQNGYNSSPKPKRYLSGANMGHESYSDLCWMAPKQGGITGIGRSCGVIGSDVLEPLADQGCRFGTNPRAHLMVPPEDAWALMRYATAGVFEETLMCDKNMAAQLKELPTHFNSTILAKWAEEL